MSEDRNPVPGADLEIEDEIDEIDEIDENAPGNGSLDQDEGGDDAIDGHADDQGPQADPQDQTPADLRRRRSSDTIRNLRTRAQTAEREIADLRDRQAQIERRPAVDPAAQARAEAEEMERVRMLAPEDQARYFYDKGRREIGAALAQQELRLADAADGREFKALAQRDPFARKYQAQIERQLAEERRLGNYGVTRDALLTFFIGKELRDKASAPRPAQVARARARIAAQTTTPRPTRGDAARPARDGDRAAYLKRLDSYKF